MRQASPFLASHDTTPHRHPRRRPRRPCLRPHARRRLLLLAALPPTPAPIHLQAHRWRYSLVERPLGEPCLWLPEARLGLAGDWCFGGRAEAAFDSGRALATAILG